MTPPPEPTRGRALAPIDQVRAALAAIDASIARRMNVIDRSLDDLLLRRFHAAGAEWERLNAEYEALSAQSHALAVRQTVLISEVIRDHHRSEARADDATHPARHRRAG